MTVPGAVPEMIEKVSGWCADRRNDITLIPIVSEVEMGQRPESGEMDASESLYFGNAVVGQVPDIGSQASD